MACCWWRLARTCRQAPARVHALPAAKRARPPTHLFLRISHAMQRVAERETPAPQWTSTAAQHDRRRGERRCQREGTVWHRSAPSSARCSAPQPRTPLPAVQTRQARASTSACLFNTTAGAGARGFRPPSSPFLAARHSSMKSYAGRRWEEMSALSTSASSMAKREYLQRAAGGSTDRTHSAHAASKTVSRCHTAAQQLHASSACPAPKANRAWLAGHAAVRAGSRRTAHHVLQTPETE